MADQLNNPGDNNQNGADLRILASDSPTRVRIIRRTRNDGILESSERIFKNKKAINFLAALVEGKTIKEAAQIAGMSYRTGQRTFADVDFQLRLREVSKQLLQQTETLLVSASSTATQTLIGILSSPTSSDTSKIRAAGLILSNALERESMAVIQLQQTFLQKLETIEDDGGFGYE